MPIDPDLLRRALGSERPTDDQRRAIMAAVGYEPTPEQEAFHFAKDWNGQPARFKLVAGGEQAGKSLSAAAELLSFLFWGKLFWIVGPQYDQTRREFEYLEAYCEILGIKATANKPQRGDWVLTTVTGQRIETKSAIKVATIAGAAPDGILAVEFAQADYEAFLRVMGRTGPRKAWCCINGTFEKDSGTWYRNLWKAWQVSNSHNGKSFSIPSWTNRHFYPGGRDDTEIKRLESLDPDPAKAHFWERFGGVPTTPKAMVFQEFNHAENVREVVRVPNAKWDAAMMFREPGRVILPEETEDEVWIDPGYTYGYAVLFVTVIANCVIVYDEVYKTGHEGTQMARITVRRPRWKYVKRLVMDISGKTHAGGQKSASDTWYEITKLRAVNQFVPVIDGVNRTRISLAKDPETGLPQLFVAPKCAMTIWEFTEGYKYPSDKMGNVLPTDKPEDKNNHAMKAIAYGLTVNFGSVARRKKVRPHEDDSKKYHASGADALRAMYARR